MVRSVGGWIRIAGWLGQGLPSKELRRCVSLTLESAATAALEGDTGSGPLCRLLLEAGGRGGAPTSGSLERLFGSSSGIKNISSITTDGIAAHLAVVASGEGNPTGDTFKPRNGALCETFEQAVDQVVRCEGTVTTYALGMCAIAAASNFGESPASNLPPQQLSIKLAAACKHALPPGTAAPADWSATPLVEKNTCAAVRVCLLQALLGDEGRSSPFLETFSKGVVGGTATRETAVAVVTEALNRLPTEPLSTEEHLFSLARVIDAVFVLAAPSQRAALVDIARSCNSMLAECFRQRTHLLSQEQKRIATTAKQTLLNLWMEHPSPTTTTAWKAAGGGEEQLQLELLRILPGGVIGGIDPGLIITITCVFLSISASGETYRLRGAMGEPVAHFSGALGAATGRRQRRRRKRKSDGGGNYGSTAAARSRLLRRGAVEAEAGAGGGAEAAASEEWQARLLRRLSSKLCSRRGRRGWFHVAVARWMRNAPSESSSSFPEYVAVWKRYADAVRHQTHSRQRRRIRFWAAGQRASALQKLINTLRRHDSPCARTIFIFWVCIWWSFKEGKQRPWRSNRHHSQVACNAELGSEDF